MDSCYYHIPASELGDNSKIPILKLGDTGEVFYELALSMVEEIEKNNAAGKRTVLICPVGPQGQYPIFVRLVNRRRICLKDCWIINMDEYLNEDNTWIDESSPLSFRGFMNRMVYSKIDPDLLMPARQRVFPEPENVTYIQELIKRLGGVDVCYGGIGMDGHLAFNEPEESMAPETFARLHTRIVSIHPYTRASNAISGLSGAIDQMPDRAVTIGMDEILGARKIRLGLFRDWHRAVIRRAAYGEVSAGFPASLLQNHPDTLIITNENAARQPF